MPRIFDNRGNIIPFLFDLYRKYKGKILSLLIAQLFKALLQLLTDIFVSFSRVEFYLRSSLSIWVVRNPGTTMTIQLQFYSQLNIMLSIFLTTCCHYRPITQLSSSMKQQPCIVSSLCSTLTRSCSFIQSRMNFSVITRLISVITERYVQS